MSNSFLRIKNQFILILCISFLLVTGLSYAYYYFVSNILINKEITYIDITLNQSAQKITSVCNELKKFTEILINNTWTKQLLKSSIPYDKYEYNKSLSNITTNILAYNSNIASISIIGTDGSMFGHNTKYFSITNQMEGKYDFTDKTRLDQFTGVYTDSIKHTSYYCYIKTITNNAGYNEFGSKIGTCILFCNISPISDIISDISLTPGTVFIILDSSGNKITASSASPDAVLKELSRLNIDYSKNKEPMEMKISGKQSLVQIKSISGIGWYLVAVAPIKEIKSTLSPLMIFSITVLLLVFGCFILIGIRITYSVSNPVETMISFMNQGAYHGLKNRLHIKEQNEFGQLSGHINNLLDEIDDMTEKNAQNMAHLYESEIAKNKAQIIALQSQINPHFLYNTLNCIKGFGYKLGSEEIVSITSSMAAIMRYSIKGPEIVEVSQELTCIHRYLDIISIRYPGKISFNFEIEEELNTCAILRFLLQPIVENAIYHGLELKPGSGRLNICGWLEDDCTIVFEIFDDGVSIPPQQLEEMNQSFTQISEYDVFYVNTERGIGLKNIAHRLRNTYGASSSIRIESEIGYGTTVTVRYPKHSSQL